MDEFFEVLVYAQWDEWTFGAHQAARRAAAVDDLVALRRQYRHLAEEDLARLAAGWRSDSASGPYFGFTAAAFDPGGYALSATLAQALARELPDGAADALDGLLDRWQEQCGHAARSGQRPVPVSPPRVAVLASRRAPWPVQGWDALCALDLEAPGFDRTLLLWDGVAGHWHIRPLG